MVASIPSQSASSVAEFEKSARAVVGEEHVLAGNVNDAVGGVQPQVVIEPGNEAELAKVLKLANDAGLAVIPRGSGSKLSWGNPPERGEVLLSIARLSAVVEYAWSDLTVTVEAGCMMKQLSETLAQRGQRLAIDALWASRATVGGVLSTNDSGALRLRFGSLRDLIIGVTLALADGTLAKSGGKVVKNVAGYDLPKLVTGALGTLGVITRATFRLHPMPRETRTISCLAADAGEAQRLMLAVQNSKLAHSALQIRFVESMPPQLDVLFEATRAGLAAQVEQLKAILAPAAVIDTVPAVWSARQELYSAACEQQANSAMAKISVLPAQIAEAYEALVATAADRVRCNAVIQGTGIGAVLLNGEPVELADALKTLRGGLEAMGGSLTIANQPAAVNAIDAWGNAGDALPLMRAVKQRFDPKSTVNPGRFVGGI